MTPLTWPCPTAGGGHCDELAMGFDRQRDFRLLIIPALFDEANRMRRLTLEVMRRLDGAGIDSFLPDLPGCNESLQALSKQTPESWRGAMLAAALEFGVTHVLGIRGGTLLLPVHLPSWRYAPVTGATLLRQLFRTRIMSSREAGLTETQDGLFERAVVEGIDLSGHQLGAGFIQPFQALTPPVAHGISEIDQDMLGGSGLWLRAEPSEDAAQADALAAILAIGVRA